MNVKIQNQSLGGKRNSGSARELATYLEHEDAERLEAGKEPLPFITPTGIPITREEVIEKIDRNHRQLASKEDRFYHLVVAPSKKEVQAMGDSEQEIYRSARKLIREISDAYAENFHKEGVQDSSDLVIYWKPHFTRGDNDELQFHLHAIVSRKSKPVDGKSLRLSPLTNHKNTEAGPVKGGFDREMFFSKCEQIFDQLFQYDRKVAESFEYNYSQKHGTLEEKAVQAERLVKEQMQQDAEAIAAGIERRKKTLRDREEVAEISEALSMGRAGSMADPLSEAFDRADLKTRIIHIFEAAESQEALDLGLLSLGATCETRIGKLGGVEEIIVIHRGVKINTADIMAPAEHNRILLRWENLTRQALEYKLRARQERAQQKPSQVPPQAQKIGRCR